MRTVTILRGAFSDALCDFPERVLEAAGDLRAGAVRMRRGNGSELPRRIALTVHPGRYRAEYFYIRPAVHCFRSRSR